MMDATTRKQYQSFVEGVRGSVARYFASKGLAVHPVHPYCLTDHYDWRGNIIDPDVHTYIQAERAQRKARGEGFALHRWGHHGLSSQALLFNLLGPLVANEDYPALDAVLEVGDIPMRGSVNQATFEYEDRSVFKEHDRQPTSVDLALWTDAGDAVFIECKFTESGFGGCSSVPERCHGANPLLDFNANCYLTKRGRTYWEVFQRHHLPGVFDLEAPECPIAGQYQLYRLVGFALKKGAHFVLLYDERNPTFVGPGGCYSGFLDDLKPAAKAKCHALTIQRAVQALERHQGSERVLEFRKKYL
jgi:hypothetical protein